MKKIKENLDIQIEPIEEEKDNNKVDIAGNCPFAIQCKNTQNLPNYFTIRENCSDKRPLALLWKKVGEVGSVSEGTLAIIPIEYFYKLLENYKK